MGIIETRLGGGGELRIDRSEIDDPCAVEISGKLQPQGMVRRFSWFIVTALPAQQELAVGMRPVLAAFLKAQGEPGLAARLMQFSVTWRVHRPPPTSTSLDAPRRGAHAPPPTPFGAASTGFQVLSELLIKQPRRLGLDSSGFPSRKGLPPFRHCTRNSPPI